MSASKSGTSGEPESAGPANAPGNGLSPELIDRPRLTDQLLLSPPARIVVLSAPAGYSKTSTLRVWADRDRRPFTWVGCDRRHDDPAILMAAVTKALTRVCPLDPGTVSALELEASWPDLALARLGRALDSTSDKFALVIDDAHMLRSESSTAILRGLASVLPPGAQLVIGSRSQPPLPLARMRANRELLELGMTDLAMTRRESRRMLRVSGLDLDEQSLESIHERTEGWPAAIHLASLALVGSPDTAKAVKDFAGDDRVVAEYVWDEFLAVSDPGLVDFMIRTSILERLTGPLCDEVLARRDSASILRELARSNALVIPLDRKDETYRYHHLFAEMLRAELIRTDPDQIPSLHARAAQWFEANARLDLAAEHAIASGDTCLAGGLIWESLPEMTGRGRVATLNRWLDEIGRDRLSDCHGLMFSAAHAGMIGGAGDQAANWLALASELTPPPDCRVPVETDLLMLRTTLATQGVGQMGADARIVLELTAPDSAWHGAASFYQGVSLHLLGDSSAAMPMLRRAAALTALESPIMQSLALAQMAIISCGDDDLGSAARLIGEAQGQVERCGLREFPVTVLVYAVEAMVRAIEGQKRTARAGTSSGLRLLSKLNSFPPWYEIEARLALTRASLQLGDPEAARDLLAQARSRLDLTPDAAVLEAWTDQLEQDLINREGDPAPTGSPLTKAEMRTLQYLPTHLSFRQIGEANDVSQNTVKTQARAIYRKLAASSRAQAVEAAREAGLLDRQAPGP